MLLKYTLEWKGGKMSLLFAPEGSYISKTTKQLLFEKQKGKCNYCGNKFSIQYFHIDHKTPISRNGSNRITNLHLLCSPCNTRKGNLIDGEFRRKYKLPGSRVAKTPPIRLISQEYFENITKDKASKNAKRRRENSLF